MDIGIIVAIGLVLGISILTAVQEKKKEK